MNAAVRTAAPAWGEARPEWVTVLARVCSESSQNRVARRLGVSAALISNVLGNKYRGDMRRVEDLVQGVFMHGTICCPALGEIPVSDCRGWRGKAKKFGSANPQRVRMYRACAGCSVNRPATATGKGERK